MSSFSVSIYSLFFFNDTATTEIYTLSLHDALPISKHLASISLRRGRQCEEADVTGHGRAEQKEKAKREQLDRKSTRLNSSHRCISYAVFCLKKKKKKKIEVEYNNILNDEHKLI